ncbi:MAG TPA: hypothetical protein VET88_02060 [Gammaproteobacteria bacterium]|nr:hypothetical protein [Gammaproteobacteria bacterium]
MQLGCRNAESGKNDADPGLRPDGLYPGYTLNDVVTLAKAGVQIAGSLDSGMRNDES